MPEVVPSRHLNRWYSVRWPGESQTTEMFAEKYFDSCEDALSYAVRRRPELAPRRVYDPFPSREDAQTFAVCIEIA